MEWSCISIEKEHKTVLYYVLDRAGVFMFLFFVVKSPGNRLCCVRQGGLDGSVSILWIWDQAHAQSTRSHTGSARAWRGLFRHDDKENRSGRSPSLNTSRCAA